jgi:hypothetical protein
MGVGVELTGWGTREFHPGRWQALGRWAEDSGR